MIWFTKNLTLPMIVYYIIIIESSLKLNIKEVKAINLPYSDSLEISNKTDKNSFQVVSGTSEMNNKFSNKRYRKSKYFTKYNYPYEWLASLTAFNELRKLIESIVLINNGNNL